MAKRNTPSKPALGTRTQGSAQAPSPPQKGIALEEGLRLYFSGLGHFALRSVPYRLEGSDVTDVDIWIYERPSTISRRRVIVDVKHKKSPQAAERLIWTKGLQAALGVESALVATTDRRAATQKLAKSLKIGLIENVPFDLISQQFKGQHFIISHSEFDNDVRELDAIRHSTEWRDSVTAIKGSLLSALGFQSANRCLNILGRIYQDVIVSPRGSQRAMTGARIMYLAAACAAISLDYAMAEYVFKTRAEREAALENGIRFGSAEPSSALSRIRTASGLVDKYLPQGRSLSKSLEMAFMADAENVPSSVIAEYVARQPLLDSLFIPATELLDASLLTIVIPFDKLNTSAKSLMGIFIDFVDGERNKFAKIWDGVIPAAPSAGSSSGELPLT